MSTINSDISDLLNDISVYLEQTRNGIMIDMASLPEKIIRVQGRVQNAPRDDRIELSKFMNQVMQSLNTLSDEIQQRHDTLGRDIHALESGLNKE